MRAGNELGQIALLLLVAAVAADLIDAQVRMRAVGQTDRSGGARNLLHGDAVRQIAEAGAAKFLFDGDAEQAELAELRPQLARKFVGAIDLGGERRDLVLRKAAHRVAQHVDLVAESEIEAGYAVRNHRALHAANQRRSGRCPPRPRLIDRRSPKACQRAAVAARYRQRSSAASTAADVLQCKTNWFCAICAAGTPSTLPNSVSDLLARPVRRSPAPEVKVYD